MRWVERKAQGKNTVTLNTFSLLPYLYTNITSRFECQSNHMQVIRELDIAHKAKESLMQKQKRRTDKRLVLLTDTLSQTNQHLRYGRRGRSV